MRAIQGTHLLSQVLHGHLSFTGCTCHFILRRLSPMVAIQSLMTCLAVVACNSDCVVGKLDIKRAFIQTEMTGVPVYAQCRGEVERPYSHGTTRTTRVLRVALYGSLCLCVVCFGVYYCHLCLYVFMLYGRPLAVY
jgi:hypothetical protein